MQDPDDQSDDEFRELIEWDDAQQESEDTNYAYENSHVNMNRILNNA